MNKPISVRMAKHLIDALDKAAKMGTRSRSQQIIRYVYEGLAREKWPVVRITAEDEWRAAQTALEPKK